MRKQILGAWFLTGLLAAGTASAQSEADVDRRWHAGLSAGLVFEDSKRQINDDENVIYGFNIGRMFTQNIGIDFQYERFDMDFGIPTPSSRSKTEQIHYGVFGRYYFRPEHATRPYLLAGIGIAEHDNAFDEGRDIFTSAGVGVMHHYTDNFAVRLQGEWRYDNDRATFNRSTGFNDFIVTAGMNFTFGAKPQPRPVVRPQPVVRPAPAPEPMFAFDAMVLFEFDSAQLRPQASAELAQAARTLNAHNELVLIEVGGHTCDMGSTAYNENLSRDRATAVYEYLVAQGVSADRLQVRAYGESQPRVPNTSIENRQQNRRVELSVLERANP